MRDMSSNEYRSYRVGLVEIYYFKEKVGKKEMNKKKLLKSARIK